MKILFITSNRLGDAVLSTGILSHLIAKTVDPEITVACGPIAKTLFEHAPGVQRVIPLPKEPYAGHWRKLWKQIILTQWDIVVDLRNSIVSRLVFAQKRYIWGKQNKEVHKVEQNAQVLNLNIIPPPYLWVDQHYQKISEKMVPDGDAPVLAVGPTANWLGKSWAVQNFIDLIYRLTDTDSDHAILADARIAVFAAPGEEDIAYELLNAIPVERQIDLIAKTTPMEAAAALKRCSYYIGNDSGLMHCAAAVGTPTLGLFGPSYPHLYQPWGAHCEFVATSKNYDELIDFEGYDPKTVGSLMDSLTINQVFQAADKHWKRLISS